MIALGPNDFLSLCFTREKESSSSSDVFFLFCKDAVSKGLIKVIQDDF